MFAMDVLALAVGLGSIVVAFFAFIVFACIRAAGLAQRYFEAVAGQFPEERPEADSQTRARAHSIGAARLPAGLQGRGRHH